MFDARQEMVLRQLVARGIRDPAVLSAMRNVPRDRFVDEPHHSEAYADRALPIDCGQTISQPYIVALMTEALELTGVERVLEVGTGSGYQTALLSKLAGSVISIERHEALSDQAGQRLENLGCTNVRLVLGDGSKGWPAEAPFDRIMVTAAAATCPPALLEQLAENGILVGPFGAADAQMLEVLRKADGRTTTSLLTPCRFVPLVEEWGGPSR